MVHDVIRKNEEIERCLEDDYLCTIKQDGADNFIGT